MFPPLEGWSGTSERTMSRKDDFLLMRKGRSKGAECLASEKTTITWVAGIKNRATIFNVWSRKKILRREAALKRGAFVELSPRTRVYVKRMPGRKRNPNCRDKGEWRSMRERETSQHSLKMTESKRERKRTQRKEGSRSHTAGSKKMFLGVRP